MNYTILVFKCQIVNRKPVDFSGLFYPDRPIVERIVLQFFGGVFFINIGAEVFAIAYRVQLF